MTFDPAFAPGCYGSALGFKETQPECQACVFASQCQPLQRQNLQAMRERYGVVVPVRKTKDTTPDGTMFAAGGVPKKVRDLMDKVEEAEISVSAILEGINPFRGRGFKLLSLATFFALNRQDGLTIAEFQAAAMKQFDWKPETANSLSRIALQALAAFEVATFEEGVLKLKKAS